ncbi:MAG TPA: Ig-like domain-containing protein [Candidatus Acidoferrales bacterium]|nr:Ig-like domain-containing protein [Candidatus Acidoferrales bacterium]
MSTADSLPAGARTILGTVPPQAAGHFVVFTAQPAAGRMNLLESDLATGQVKRVTSDNDQALVLAGGPSGNPLLSSNFFLSDTGEIAFETVNFGRAIGLSAFNFGSSPTNNSWENSAACGNIYLWSASGIITKVAAAGDPVPNSSAKFSCVALNSGPPSPLNHSGELTFFSSSPLASLVGCTFCNTPPGNSVLGIDGIFLYHPGGSITEIAAADDTLPGQTQATTFVPYLATPLNSADQVAFGAQVGTTSQAFYLKNGSSAQSVISLGDSVPGGTDTFGFPHFISGLADNGNLTFTAATSSVIDGLFLAPSGGPIQTLALQGGAAPASGGGVYSLPDLVLGSISVSGSPPVTIYSFKNFAEMNSESDVAFGSAITGGSADSGYFRMLQSGPSAGTLQAVVAQGQAVPGGGTLSTIPTTSAAGGTFALGPDGSLAFVNPLTTSSGLEQGMFVARPDGTLLKVASTGDVLPGGEVLSGISMSPKLSAGNAGTFAFLGGILGGSARSGIFVTAIPPGVAATTVTLSPLLATAVAQQPTAFSATVVGPVPGSPSGTVTFFASGISLGTGTLNSSGQASISAPTLAAGQDSIVAQYSGDANFAAANSSPLAIVVAGFAPPQSPLVVTRGQSLVIPITLYAPATPAMSFTLSCSGLPANASCSFDNNPVTPGPTGTTVHLTLTTMAGAKLPLGLPHKEVPPLLGYELATLLASILVAKLFWRRAPRWRLVPCACFATFALAFLMGGCGASGAGSYNSVTTGTPAGPTTVTVTGISGNTTISTVVNVIVQ